MSIKEMVEIAANRLSPKIKYENPYAKANIFVGDYEIPENGWLRFEDPKIKYMLQLPSGHAFIDDSPDTRATYPDARRWLIVQDRSFWPIMVEVGHDE